jgi:hypothetical protein
MIKSSMKPFAGVMEFDHVTIRYLYPDKYIEMTITPCKSKECVPNRKRWLNEYMCITKIFYI